jgi:hypothetical protein
MKVRKFFLNSKEKKVFIHENKKEEYIMVAIPELHWSVDFTYDEGNVQEKIYATLNGNVAEQEAEALSARIYQWTREM